MKTFAIAAIDGYQRFISPYKGFGCAHRVRTGGASCSRFAKRAIASLGMIAGLLVTSVALKHAPPRHGSSRARKADQPRRHRRLPQPRKSQASPL
ncbi:membrane protein insertion efficiency factor YidD [Variovorax sp. LARHSF232]